MPTQQTTSHLFMVRPANFGYNEETADSNAFQVNDTSRTQQQIKEQAIREFDAFVAKLRSKGINVYVAEDAPIPHTPDAVFPNNWITFHENGDIITYPMFASARRNEIDERHINMLAEKFEIKQRIRLEHYVEKELFLEGTGSLIFDHPNQLVYACLSPRTHHELLQEFCEITGYKLVAFESVDQNGQQIYHTNVMMAMGETFVVICLDTIANANELKQLTTTFERTNKEIIGISLDQMMAFAGNMLQVRNDAGDTFLVMSEQAFKSLSQAQIEQIEQHTQILYSPIETIETYGGGSARCMMAEVFLPLK